MNKNLAMTLLGTAGFALCATCGILGFGSAIKQNAPIDRSAWMASLPDNTAYSDLSLPGTHDTMALYGIGDLAGQCQSLELPEQLKLGVRFLDLRLQLQQNTLRAVHGIVDQKETFANIASTLQTFLKNNPSETLVVSIKEENDPSRSSLSFEEAIKKVVDPAYWLFGRDFPETLEKGRGKIVMMSRYANATIGIDAYASWSDNASFALNESIYVQDEYKVAAIAQKKSAVQACFDVSSPYRINFVSGYFTSHFPPSYAIDVAKEMNSWAIEVMPSIAKKGFLLFDFITEPLMSAFFGGGQ